MIPKSLRALTLLTFVALAVAQTRAQESAAPVGPVLPPAPSIEYESVPPASGPATRPEAVSPGPTFESPGSPGPVSPGPIPPGAIPPAPLPAGPITTLPPSGCLSEGFWIASSWNCRQSAPHACPCGDLEFYYRGGDGQTQLLNRDAFTASLTPGTPVCVVVHGSFTNWKSFCQDCGPVFNWIRCSAPSKQLAVIFYTWPSAGPITYEPHLDVAILGMRASFNGVYLGDLVARIPSGHPVCIIGHSHGARMTAAALHLLGGGEVDGTRLTYLPPADQRIRSVLVAGALDHHWLDPGQRFGLALCRAEGLLYLRNDHDIVLSLYPMRRVFSRRALGESGLSRRDHQRLGELNCKVTELDVTRIIHSGHMWNHYYIHPELSAAIEPFVYFDDGQSGFVPTAANMPAGDSERSADSEPLRGTWKSLRSRFVKNGE